MRLFYLCFILLLLVPVYTGCAGINTMKIMLSWRGQAATALIASWGQPTADLSATDFATHSEYYQKVLDKSGPPTNPDPPVARVLVYRTAVGNTYKDVTGKQSFTIDSSNTTIYIGVDANGTVLKFATDTKG